MTVSALTLMLVGCDALGGSGGGAGHTLAKGDDITVGLLLPEKTNTRYKQFDYPIIKAKVEALTRNQGKVEYANANSNAQTQATQMQEMIASKVDVILLDAVDSHAIASMVTMAKDAGILVIAYDRLAEGPIDAYVSFDNELVGQMQGRALVDSLGPGDHASDKVVMINGPSTDPNAEQIKAGALSEFAGKVTVAATFEVLGWNPEIAESAMAEAILKIGKDNIAGVYAANDSLAGGVVKAFKAAGVTDLPPITGQDAELAAIQRLVSGEQYMSVYKPYPAEAAAAATMAVAKVQGKDILFDAMTPDKANSPTTKDVPSQLVPVSVLTKDYIKDTVVADGIYTVADICTANY
jgi:D-xylose transport system substrate-binding protein